MAIPGSVIAAGWIPFIIVIVLSIFFSGFYIRYFMSKYDSELSSTITCIFALTITLLTSAIVPVDIFLVSYMKNSDGSFKDWANSTSVRAETVDSVLIGYYVLYGVVSFCLFLLLPFMYFYYEEKEDDSTWKSRCCTALKFSIVTVLIAATLLLVGAFVPAKLQHSANGTEWNKVEDLFKNVASTGIEDALSFVISIFSVFGMIGIVTYTAYGMSAMPMDLVKGRKSAKKERMKTQADKQDRQQRREERREKFLNTSSSSSTRRSRGVQRRDEEERLMGRKERHLIVAENSCLRKCCVVLRPFEIIFGIGFFLLALLIFLSLLLTNIDKAMHSLGYESGYVLPKRHLPNPIDIVLVFCQKVFPLDYILMVGIIAYFVLCSMSGIRNIGIWFLWIKMYKVRPRRTPPQGLLMFCMILMFIVLAINVLLYEITPQYSSFGSQHYMSTTHGNHSDTSHTKACNTNVSDDECIVTRMTLLLVRFFYKMWIFGAAYYWGTWLFLGTLLIGFFVSVIKSRRSAISGEVDEDDFEESDDDDMLAG